MNRVLIKNLLNNYLMVCGVTGGIYTNYKIYKDLKKSNWGDEDIFYVSIIGSPFTLSLGFGIGMIIGAGSLLTVPLGLLIYCPIKIMDKISNNESV
jgi:hypothetical protein